LIASSRSKCAAALITGNMSFFLQDRTTTSGDLTGLRADTSPNLPSMDRDTGIDLEAQSHVRTLNIKHRDFEQAMKTIVASDHHRFSVFS
jgi:hypothetical protein